MLSLDSKVATVLNLIPRDGHSRVDARKGDIKSYNRWKVDIKLFLVHVTISGELFTL